MRLSFALIALLCLLAPHSAHAVSPERILQVSGSGDAQGGGLEARRAAIVNARNAILIDHLEYWGDSGRLSRLAPILDRAESYFRSIRVLRHSMKGEATRVDIEAELLVSKLRKDVGTYILPTLSPKPTVLVIVQDDFGPDAVRRMEESGETETFLRKVLHGAGFEVIEPDRMRAAISPETMAASVGGADGPVAEAARSLFADVAIIGRATTSTAENPRRSNLIRNRGSIALRIVRAADDAIVEELHATGVVESRDADAGGQLAVEDACEKLVDSLISGAIMAVLFAPEDDAVRLSLAGGAGVDEHTAFTTWLASQAHVDGVEIVGEDAGMLRLRVEYDAPVSRLVELLEDGAAVRITRVLDRNVSAELVPVGGDAVR